MPLRGPHRRGGPMWPPTVSGHNATAALKLVRGGSPHPPRQSQSCAVLPECPNKKTPSRSRPGAAHPYRDSTAGALLPIRRRRQYRRARHPTVRHGCSACLIVRWPTRITSRPLWPARNGPFGRTPSMDEVYHRRSEGQTLFHLCQYKAAAPQSGASARNGCAAIVMPNLILQRHLVHHATA